MLLVARHLAEGERKAVGQEHRVVAEPLGAAWRPHQRAVDLGLEFLEMPVRPRDAQRRDEMRLALVRRRRAALAQQRIDARHRGGEILRRSGPARRMDAGLAAEGIDREARVVREGGQARALRGGLRLDARIGAEGRAGLVRLGQAELAGRDRQDAVEREQLAHLDELAGIMRRDHQAAADAAVRGRGVRRRQGCAPAHVTAIFCRSTSLPMPLRASASRASSCSSLNGVFSAVPCTSTMLPVPVMTKLASVSASESSA